MSREDVSREDVSRQTPGRGAMNRRRAARPSWPVDFEDLKRRPFETIAADWGYVRDTAASTAANPVLRAPGLPKLVTRRRGNGHWIYFNTIDPDDNGTIIDFMLRRGLSYRDICDRFAPPAGSDFRSLWDAAVPDPAPDRLIERGIQRQTLAVYRALIRRDRNGHVLFAHRDRNRIITGFEIAPPDGARRFAAGGTRSLFALCAAAAGDLTTLVITEGAIDALSLAQIDQCPTDHAFLSTAGAPAAAQCAQIGRAARILPAISTIILAQDADDAGDRQAETLRTRVDRPSHVCVLRRRPPDNTDWNDVLRRTP